MQKIFARNAFLGAFSGLLTSGGNVASGVLVARILGPEGSGQIAYLIWIALFVAPLLDLGIASAVGRFVPELRGAGDSEAGEWLAGVLRRRLIIVLATFVLLVPCALALAAIAPWGEALGLRGGALLLAVLVVCHTTTAALAAYGLAYLRGRQAFRQVARLAVVSFGLQVAGVALGGLLFGIAGALGGYVAGQIVPAIAALLRRHAGQKVSPSLWQRVRRYAAYAWAANIATAFVWSRIEVFFLQQFWGPTEVGLFAAALTLTSLAAQAPLMLTTGILAVLSERKGKGDQHEMRRICATGTRLLALITFPLCLGMAGAMPLLLPLVFGRAFEAAVPAGMVLALAAAIGATTSVATTFVQALERNDFIFFSGVAGAVVAILVGFMLVPAFGVVGAAAGRASIQLMLVACGMWFVVARLECALPFAMLARLFAAAAVAAAIVFATVVTLPPLGAALVAPLAASAAYLLGLRLLDALHPEDAHILDRLAAALPVSVRPAARAAIAFAAG